MEAIEKAKVLEFRDRVATQFKQTQEQLVQAADTVKKLDGALAALNNILQWDTVTFDESDEITEDDIEDSLAYAVESAA